MDGLFKIIDDGITEKKELKLLVKKLLSIISEDKNGDFLICKENLDLLNKIEDMVK